MTPRQIAASIKADLGSRERVLAVGEGEGVIIAGLPAALAIRVGSEPWRLVGYHDVLRGGWREADRTLAWESLSGSQESHTLSVPGRLPELFRERVTASILVDQITGAGSQAIRVTARRDLADPTSELIWRATPVDPTADATQLGPVVDRALRQAKSDYTNG